MLNLALVSARERFIIFTQVLRTIRNEALFFLFLELIYTGLQGEQILLFICCISCLRASTTPGIAWG